LNYSVSFDVWALAFMSRQPPEITGLDQRPLPSWGISLVVHAALMIILGLVLHRVPKGAGEEPIRTVGIVLRHVTDEREWFEGEDNQLQHGDTSSTQSPSTEDLLNALPQDSGASAAEVMRSLPLPGPGGAEEGQVGDAGQMTQGGGGNPRGAPGGKARVRVFGAEGVGSSFLYLFDRSASMEGAPLAATQRELIGSLDSLDSTHQFHILFFNHQVTAWDLTGGQRRVAYANDRNKELAAQFVRGISAYSGTDRFAALSQALAHKPDVLFFLTDADSGMSPYEVDRVTERNGGRTAITCIEFGVGPARGGNFLVELARRNGGQYIYVDTRRFEN
jgi:hypothetical protein